MLNAEAEVARLVILLRAALSLGESVERHLRGAVSDSVKADLEAGQRARNGHAIQFALLILREAGVARIVGIRRQQRGRARTQRAIHEAFQHGRMQHWIVGGMMCAMRLQQADRIVEPQPFADAQRQLAFPLQVLVHKKGFPTGIVLSRGDAPTRGVGQRKFGGAAQTRGSRQRDFGLDQSSCRFAQNAGGLAVGFVVDFAACRRLRLRCNSSRFQGRCVGYAARQLSVRP